MENLISHCGWMGAPEVTLIIIAVLLLFGGKKIPELAKGLGKGIKEFKKTAEETEIKEDLKDIASEINDLKKDVDQFNPKKILKDESLNSRKK